MYQPSYLPCAMGGSTLLDNTPSASELDIQRLETTYPELLQYTPPSAQLADFGTCINRNAAVPQSRDYMYMYQNPFQALPPQSIALNTILPVSMTSLPEMSTMHSSPEDHISKSLKIRNKIRELHPFYSRRLAGGAPLKGVAPLEGKTRTRDKYRVVYTEKQRLGLEKAYTEDKFITTARKAELSKELALSDRQIKIWFQNRRAKERRDERKNSPDVDTDSHDNTDISKPSCRFEKENVSPCTTHSDVPSFPSLQTATAPGHSVSGYSPTYLGYESSLIPLTANQKNADTEVTSHYPDVAHARFQLSPSEWMEAHHQSIMPTLNVSPFTSSFNFLPRV